MSEKQFDWQSVVVGAVGEDEIELVLGDPLFDLDDDTLDAVVSGQVRDGN